MEQGPHHGLHQQPGRVSAWAGVHPLRDGPHGPGAVTDGGRDFNLRKCSLRAKSAGPAPICHPLLTLVRSVDTIYHHPLHILLDNGPIEMFRSPFVPPC